VKLLKERNENKRKTKEENKTTKTKKNLEFRKSNCNIYANSTFRNDRNIANETFSRIQLQHFCKFICNQGSRIHAIDQQNDLSNDLLLKLLLELSFEIFFRRPYRTIPTTQRNWHTTSKLPADTFILFYFSIKYSQGLKA